MNKIPVIHPSSWFKWIWDAAFFCFVLIYNFLIPIHLCYEVPFDDIISPGFDSLTPVIFILDIIINLCTGYYDRGLVILGKIKILKHYLLEHFLTDFIAVMPFIIYHYGIFNRNDIGPDSSNDNNT